MNVHDDKPTTVYLSGSTRAYPTLRALRKPLIERGYSVVSTWLDGPVEPYEAMSPERFETVAIRDLQDLARSDLFIIDTLLPVNGHAGREVEFGYALIVCQQIWRVGPVRNVFHTLVDRAFATWEEALDAID